MSSYDTPIPDDIPLSPREVASGGTVASASEIDRIGRGEGGLAVYAAKVRVSDRYGRPVGRVVLALDRARREPLCIRVRAGDELDRLIAALEVARRDLHGMRG